MNVEVGAITERGRSKRKFIDVVKEDMRMVGVTKEHAEERVKCTAKQAH